MADIRRSGCPRVSPRGASHGKKSGGDGRTMKRIRDGYFCNSLAYLQPSYIWRPLRGALGLKQCCVINGQWVAFSVHLSGRYRKCSYPWVNFAASSPWAAALSLTFDGSKKAGSPFVLWSRREGTLELGRGSTLKGLRVSKDMAMIREYCRTRFGLARPSLGLDSSLASRSSNYDSLIDPFSF